MGVSSSVITTLLQPYMNKGHSLWVDNWYSSPTLFNFLHQRQTNACGTVRKKQKRNAKIWKKLKIGETEAKHTQNLLALKYKDKREVFMLSTMHKNEFANTNKRDKFTNLPIQKPSAVIDYNQKMGTVDQTDMLLSSIGCLRKSLKWYKKLFFHFIDTSLLNAYSLYLVNTGKRPSLAEFHINLIGQIIEKYHEARVQVHRGRPSTSEDRPLRLIERHFPSLVPPTEKKKNPTRYCRVCGANKKRKESRYMCKDCDVALCVVPCQNRMGQKDVTYQSRARSRFVCGLRLVWCCLDASPGQHAACHEMEQPANSHQEALEGGGAKDAVLPQAPPPPCSKLEGLLQLKNSRVLPGGHASTPASPEESEHRAKVRNFHSPSSDKKITAFWEGGGGTFVRSSKSEDHLQKTSLSTVSIDIEEDMASSLNTLLDTKPDGAWSSFQVPTSPQSPDSPPPPSLKSPSSSSESVSPIKTASLRKPPEPADKPVNSMTSSDSPTIIKDSVINEEEADSTSDLVSTISSSEEAENLPESELNSPLDGVPLENHDMWADPESPWCMQNCVALNISDLLGDCSHIRAAKMAANPSPFDNNFEWPPDRRPVPGSPNSIDSTSTLEEVPYEELQESHDEDSVLEEVRSASPPTDDESDIESLHSFHYSPKAVDMPSASRLAKRLYNLEGFKKSDVSRHLSKK
ncbi:hypothetical protein LAZ67_6000940 [Cordylochernes scorpioides]|uniref:PiggyBac transposable element-derived protein domain-containing protein n=1 Tax=Cordylochernes scorpioides TaxID=51811 RepID=A0ABY6KIZ6_9ARAC|nr:hypothetical protein LAZ67_6000940 [Cordylochernes scorpioides]